MSPELSVVIVDDMKSTRMVLKHTLEQAGYTNIRLTVNGMDALKSIVKQRADVMIVDWQMPKMDGLELTRTIRRREKRYNNYTSIILLTGNDEKSALKQAFQDGVDDYLSKPFKTYELLSRVHSAGRVSHLQNALLYQNTLLQDAQIRQQKLVTRDTQTGLFNRRHLRSHLSAVMDQTQTRGGSVCFALVDIDGLSMINDNYGQEIGNEVLARLAKRIQHLLRPMDFVSRQWGGVFGTLLYNTQEEIKFLGILQRILDKIAKEPIPTSKGDIPITCSIGAQCYQKGQSWYTATEMELLAISRLKQAKLSGPGSLAISEVKQDLLANKVEY
jgi:diguanylate cyclase (GGDEF)-like protein